MTQYHTTPTIIHREKASMPAPKGSVTIEAALAVPIFLFAVLSLVYLLEGQAIHFRVQAAAMSAAKTVAQEIPVVPIFSPAKVHSEMIHTIGSERLDRSIVEGGSSGLHCGSSYLSQTGEIHVKVRYRIRLPFPYFTGAGMTQQIECLAKAWTGYENGGLAEDDDIVYVTETGSVYHTDPHCTYLQLSIQFVPSASLPELRNESGGRYHACEKCVYGSAMAGCYITSTGNKYHNSLTCSGLKRTVFAVKRSETGGKGVCSRCG